MPLPEFTDERIDAEAILHPQIHQVHEHMSNAGSYDGIYKLLKIIFGKE